MRRLGLALILVAALPGAAGAGSDQWAQASVAPAHPGAKTVLALRLHYEMTCGQPRGSVTVRFPARMQLLGSFGVRLGPKTIPNAIVQGTSVTFEIPQRPGMTCMSIAPATALFTFTGLRNPSQAGSYLLRAQAANLAFAARVLVKS
jgi:hypothetical protein